MIAVEYILLGTSIILLLSIVASKTSEKLGIPVLLLFLLIGMIIGSDGLNIVYFDDFRLAQSIGIIALAFILFDGGISTKWETVRPLLAKGIALSTAGVFLTALLLGLFASYVLHFSLIPVFFRQLILGAIAGYGMARPGFSLLTGSGWSTRGCTLC